jgi:hypothetical protein
MNPTKLLFLFFIVTSCKVSKEIMPDDTPIIVKNEFEEFLTTFKKEAELRGKKIDISALKTRLDATLTNGYIGLCDQKLNEITIDSATWRKMSIQERELLVFHELGHCVFGRGHKNKAFQNGEFASIMRSGDSDPSNAGIYYFSFRKKYYIDELFDENTTKPEWADNQLPYHTVKISQKKIIVSETFDDNRNKWKVVNNKDSTIKMENGSYYVWTRIPVQCPFDINFNEDFEIEFDFKIIPNPENRGLFFFFFGDFTNNKGVNAILYLNNKGNSLRFPQFNVLSLSLYTAPINKEQYNKFTIRKIGDLLYYYLNEQPFYYFGEANVITKNPLWFGCLASMQFDNIVYSSILK